MRCFFRALSSCVLSLDALEMKKAFQTSNRTQNRMASQQSVGGPHVMVEITDLHASPTPESTINIPEKVIVQNDGVDM